MGNARSDYLWDVFAALPAEAQREVADFIAFLRRRHSVATGEQSDSSPALEPEENKAVILDMRSNATELGVDPFIGIWRDRSDLEDSTTWVRNARLREWIEPNG